MTEPTFIGRIGSVTEKEQMEDADIPFSGGSNNALVSDHMTEIGFPGNKMHRVNSGPVLNKKQMIQEKINASVLINDHFQNYRRYNIPKAQLIIADIPFNISKNAYASNPSWYVDGDNKNGESHLAGKEFFDTDKDFRITEFLHFCSTMLMKEPKEPGMAPCMIVFCEFEQQFELIRKAPKYGLNKYINLVFRKNFSAQVLKANMRVVGNCEYALILYRDKLPKFNNEGRMIFNCMDWIRDMETPKIHPTQKPVKTIERLIRIFTDPSDVVIDPVAGSGSTLLAAAQCDRRAYGFEIKKNFCKESKEKILSNIQKRLF